MLVALLFSSRLRGFSIYWVCLFLLIGMTLGVFNVALLDQDRTTLANSMEGIEQQRFMLTEDAKLTSSGSQARTIITAGPHAGKRVLLFVSNSEPLFVGDIVVGQTRLSVPDDDYLSYYDQRGLSFSAKLTKYELEENDTALSLVYQLRKELLSIIGSGSNEQTLLRAILFGERRDLFDASFYHDIKVVGLAHLVAVSGAHLVIVTGFVTVLLRRLRLTAKINVALQTLFLLLYLVLVGFPISCIRAAIMSAVTLFALLARRRSSSLTALGVTTLVMVVVDPTVVHQLSFQLSVASTFGIVLFMPLINEWFGTLFPRVPTFVRETTSMTLAALMFSLPISAAQFSMIPLISPVANLIATPYLTILLLIGFCSLAVGVFVPCVFSLLSGITSGLIGCFTLLGSLPFASIPVSLSLAVTLPLAFAGAVFLWLWWPRPRVTRRALCFSVSIALLLSLVVVGVHVEPGLDRIVMLNVGQGDSFALVSRGKTVLVDTGKDSSMLYSALARNRIDRIDALIVTHPDDDHCGSLSDLVGVISIDRILVADGLDEVDDARVQEFLRRARRVVGEGRVTTIKRGEKIRFGSFLLDVVAPLHVENEGGNEDSICFYARLDCDNDGVSDWTSFFCGDAEVDTLRSLADAGLLERVDLYKVGHHGSRKALDDDLAALLRPRVSLIGVGKNSYGHPTQETLDRLSAVGSQIHRSDNCGDVVCSFTKESLELSCQRAQD